MQDANPGSPIKYILGIVGLLKVREALLVTFSHCQIRTTPEILIKCFLYIKSNYFQQFMGLD